MNDQHMFMLFGLALAGAGFFLAATARAGHGQTTIRLLGSEITLAAAGGIVVMALGAVVFSLPYAITITRDNRQVTTHPYPKPVPLHLSFQHGPWADGLDLEQCAKRIHDTLEHYRLGPQFLPGTNIAVTSTHNDERLTFRCYGGLPKPQVVVVTGAATQARADKASMEGLEIIFESFPELYTPRAAREAKNAN